jgi:putative transposase
MESAKELILQSVRKFRDSMPRIGSRKLFELVKQELGKIAGFPGRDKFINLLVDNKLMLKIRRRKRYKTTDSNHPYRRYPNLIKDREFSEPNQGWASDITYVETQAGVCYLSLITDLYSHKIVGWELGGTLSAVYCVNALKKALEGLSAPEQANGLIHHSDRGCQYCCYEYVDVLKARGIRISMTEKGDPLENAVAERVNGIIKNEWLNTEVIKDADDCRARIEKAINAYNEMRPHMSLGYQTPSSVHKQSGKQNRLWKTFAERNSTVKTKGEEKMPDGIPD